MNTVIIKKTLYERRISTLLWFLTMVGFVLLTILFFPTLRDSFGESLKEVPESLQQFLGSANDYQTLIGYVDLQVIAQMIFMTVIMAIISGTALLAGEERTGTLHTQLARPISRASVYWQKTIALAIMTFVVAALGVFAGIVLGTLLLREDMNYWHAFLASCMTWLVTFFFAALAFSLGAITGKRSIAGIVAGAYAFVAYMITALAQMADALKTLDYASVFHYFNHPSVMHNGLDLGNVVVVTTATAALFVLGVWRFMRRDIINR